MVTITQNPSASSAYSDSQYVEQDYNYLQLRRKSDWQRHCNEIVERTPTFGACWHKRFPGTGKNRLWYNANEHRYGRAG